MLPVVLLPSKAKPAPSTDNSAKLPTPAGEADPAAKEKADVAVATGPPTLLPAASNNGEATPPTPTPPPSPPVDATIDGDINREDGLGPLAASTDPRQFDGNDWDINDGDLSPGEAMYGDDALNGECGDSVLQTLDLRNVGVLISFTSKFRIFNGAMEESIMMPPASMSALPPRTELFRTRSCPPPSEPSESVRRRLLPPEPLLPCLKWLLSGVVCPCSVLRDVCLLVLRCLLPASTWMPRLASKSLACSNNDP
jgi:hypothetical protein